MGSRAGILLCLIFVPLWIVVNASASPADCSNDVTLTSQKAVDDFAATYNCTQIVGMLTISGNDIKNLSGLSSITSVGSLSIVSNDSLTNLNGLSKLNTIGATCSCAVPGLVISDNKVLTDLHGLSSLSRLDGNLEVSGNNLLTNLEGLEKITSIGDMLDIYDNARLTNLDALSSVAQVGTWHLSNQSVRISNNASLTEISILKDIVILPGELSIENNASLIEVDGFSSMQRIAGRRANLLINNNPQLKNINGFKALTTIVGGGQGGTITISNNAILKNMDGFSSLVSIEGGITGGLVISNNQTLTEVDGLSQLLSIRGGNFYLKVIDNPTLDRGCGLYPLLHHNGVGGDWCDSSTCPAITISGNGPNCTREAILRGGPCHPGGCPEDRDVITEMTTACGSLSTKIIIKYPEANVTYTLRDNQNNKVVAETLPGSAVLLTGEVTKTTTYNIVARNSATGCEVVMNAKPVITINPLPLDKVAIAEIERGCGSVSTQVLIKDYEPSIEYSLRCSDTNKLFSGPSKGSAALATGVITSTTHFYIVARNTVTGCEKKLTSEPVVTINPLPQDHAVVVENDSIVAGASTNITVPEGESHVMYSLRSDANNLLTAGPVHGPPILSTGALFETTTFNVLASAEKCERVLSTRVTVNVIDPLVASTSGMSFSPNPSNGAFQIQLPSDRSGEYHLSLHDLAGSLVKEKSIGAFDELHAAQIDLKPLPAGTYLVSVTGPGGILLRKKLVITE